MAGKRRVDAAPRVRLPGLGGKPFRKQVLGETSTRSGQVKCGNLLGTLQRADHVKLGGVAPLNRHNSLFLRAFGFNNAALLKWLDEDPWQCRTPGASAAH